MAGYAMAMKQSRCLGGASAFLWSLLGTQCVAGLAHSMRGAKSPGLNPPDPTIIWVNEDFVQPAMGRPAEEQCFGCQCMAAFPGLWLANGTFSEEYTCEQAKLQNLIPEFHWGGPKDGKKCRSCQAFALTIEDLDYPHGMGSADNGVHNIFWIANIPGDWMAINQTAVDELSEFAPTMVVGRNSKGDLGMEPPCPNKGMHRYHVVMWSLDSQLDDIDADITYGALKSLLEAHELARATFYAQLSASRFVNLQQAGAPAPAPAASPAA